MANKIWFLLIAAIASSIAYRLGGKQGYNTKIRDLVCPLIALITLWLLAGFKSSYWWAYLLTFGLMFGSLTTYWDWMFKNKDSMALHGAGIGLAVIPLLWCNVAWYVIIGRVILLALSFGLINKYVNKWLIPHSDEIEEYSRGFLIVATLPVLII